MLASVELISAWVPVIVSPELPLAPALIVALPASVTFKTPSLTLNSVEITSLLASLTLTPLITSGVSSLTVCVPGTVFTGGAAGSTLITELNDKAVVFWPPPVVTPLSTTWVSVSVRSSSVGLALVLS